MTVILNIEYSEQEQAFLKKHNCKILSEIKLPNSLTLPTRMFSYGNTYIGEIKEDDGLVWAVLSKFKGRYHWSECYSDLDALEGGL